MNAGALVTLEATGAWEVWDVALPDDAPTNPDELYAYVVENLGTLEKSLLDSGADSYAVTEVEDER